MDDEDAYVKAQHASLGFEESEVACHRKDYLLLLYRRNQSRAGVVGPVKSMLN